MAAAIWCANLGAEMCKKTCLRAVALEDRYLFWTIKTRNLLKSAKSKKIKKIKKFNQKEENRFIIK